MVRTRASVGYRVGALALGAGLLSLGIPQTEVSVLELYAERGMVLGPASELPTHETAGTAASLKEIDQRFGVPEARLRAGEIEEQSALRAAGGTDLARLADAADDLADGLSRAPANARSWAELAQARMVLDNPSLAIRAWIMSLKLAPYDPSLNLWRAEIALPLWLSFNGEQRQVMFAQLRGAWRETPKDMVAAARRDSFLTQLIRLALAQQPQELDEFDVQLARGS